MKLLKKILRIICIILPAFGFVFLLPQSASAKSYSVSKFLAHGISTINTDGNMVQVATGPVLYLDDTSGLDFRHDTYLLTEKSGSQCQYSSFTRLGYTVYQKEVDFGSTFVFPYYELLAQQNISNSAVCRSYASFGGTSGTFSIPTYNRLSAPAGYQPDIGAIMPYSYDIADVLYQKPSFWITSDNFDISRIQGYELPLNFGAWEDLKDGTDLIINFRIKWGYIPTHMPNGWSSDFIQQGIIQATLKGVDGNSIYTSLSNCYFTDDILQSDVQCKVPVDHLLPKYHYGISIKFGWPSGVAASSLFDYEFESFGIGIEVITNNDFSLATISGEFETGGNNVNNAPMLPPHDTTEEEWFNQLTHMFNFSLLNPFASIFNMFQNSSECHHIPIIAGMLNVEDDEYCPWFPATVRQITTPVISIAATMLLFGFFISFLKSGSGNDTIDTGGHGSIYKGKLH